MLTGESVPVEKSNGDFVTGGSTNQNGQIKYVVTKIGKDTVLSKIVDLVNDAQDLKHQLRHWQIKYLEFLFL